MQETRPVIKSGDCFQISGFYRYHGHVGKDEGCFVPRATCFMLFEKGQKATKLGACPHDVKWQLITRL